MVELTQYRVTAVSRKSLEIRDSRPPWQSLRDRHFSNIQAASLAGESMSA